MAQLNNKNQKHSTSSLTDSYLFLMSSTNDKNDKEKSYTEASFKKFSLYEDAKYETHVSCNFENIKL